MPLYPRIILWIVFALAILVAAILGLIVLAGNTSSARERLTLVAFAFLIACAAQSGYLMAPFVIGRTDWLLWLTLILMVPALLAIVASVATPVYLAITATRPDGASGWRTIAGIGPFSLVALVIYGAPPLLLFMHRAR
jgi:hypothetical protein